MDITYVTRDVQMTDLETICSFPQNEDELYFMFPKATFPLTPEQLLDAVNHRFDSTIILSARDEIVGFANFYEVSKEEYCSIGNVIINPKHRRLGAASYLIKTMEEKAVKKYHAKEIHISCFNNNVSALLLYYKLGYKPFEIEKRLDKKSIPVALIKMKKCLNQPNEVFKKIE